MGTVRSGASRSRLSWSCRRAVRPIVRASVAAAEGGARIWDANLGFGACAAQEFRLVDDRDAERLGLLELGPRVGAHDEGGGLLRDAVRDVPACAPAWRMPSACSSVERGCCLDAWMASTSC